MNLDIRDLPTFERWPALYEVLKPDRVEELLLHLNQWCRDKPDNTGKEMRAEVHRWLMEKFKNVPHEQLADALAEVSGCYILQTLKKLFTVIEQKLKDN